MHREILRPACRSALLTSLLIAATGCAEGVEARSDASTFSVDTVAGIPRMHTAGAPQEWQLEPLLRIGTIEGGPQEFGSVRSVVADPDGNVFVADGLAREIRVFAVDGRHLRTFGREGAGPGEFRNLVSLAWVGDLLAANDPGNGRIQLFTREGEPQGVWSGSTTTGPPQVLRMRPQGNDEFFALGVRRAGERLQSVWVRHTAEGAADTVSPPDPPAGVTRGMLCHRSDGALASFRFSSRPELIFGFAPESRVVSAWTDGYRVSLLNAAGDTTGTVTWDRDLVPVSDSAWAEDLKPYEEMRENFPGSSCEPSAPARPEHRSTLREILHDDAGRMWVEAATADGFAWDVFDRSGEWIGIVAAPDRDPRVSPYVRGDVLYQVETDEMGVQYVTGYRLRSDSASRIS